jgi:hypothetical protein
MNFDLPPIDSSPANGLIAPFTPWKDGAVFVSSQQKTFF